MGDYEPLKASVDIKNDVIICADGGTRHLDGLCLKPNYVIGDLDSTGELPVGVEVLKFKSEKDETDTMLAVMQGLKLGFHEFLILGGLKGRLDHTYANLSTLLYLSRHGGFGSIRDADNEAFIVENGQISFKKRTGCYISVFPFGGDATGVTEKGFKYELCDAILHADFPNGVSNEFLEDEGSISVKTGALLIILSRE